ncbi:Ammonia monooxygenase gamma subunit [Polaromonas vacuolata]|uniref:Ammonia monooxygenase gamma subunit n=1 Tax=Polaromonas vacuolata TaxID=37448 RepID=A0A6H2HCF3_9BURK|nr:cytochrome c1 [Polaromonas vacuolata]QJC57561.1 Ammonia monooxygenase gamma subunit [Polaromonas vacuolata]
MKKFLLTLIAALGFVAGAQANEAGISWDKAPNKSNDLVALQHGAKLFVNYCLNCHAAAYMRYNRLTDIGLTAQQIKDNLMFATDKVGDTMNVAITADQGKILYGVNPPDLSVIARSRSGAGGSGSDYIYTYLRTYYRDSSKATGWNNLAYPNAAMPHVLWQLQGERKPVYEEREEHGHKVALFKGWEQVTPGTMTPLKYDQSMGDLVGYLQWMAEPARNTRVRTGVWVLMFLMLLTFAAWRLNAAFWKDVK